MKVDIHPMSLADMRSRGGVWAAYQNQDLGSNRLGDAMFYKMKPGEAVSNRGSHWSYTFIGFVDLVRGEIEETRWTETLSCPNESYAPTLRDNEEFARFRDEMLSVAQDEATMSEEFAMHKALKGDFSGLGRIKKGYFVGRILDAHQTLHESTWEKLLKTSDSCVMHNMILGYVGVGKWAEHNPDTNEVFFKAVKRTLKTPKARNQVKESMKAHIEWQVSRGANGNACNRRRQKMVALLNRIEKE
jgi:hypothetical protein